MNNIITKPVLVDMISDKMDITKKDAREVVDCVFDTVTDILVSGDKLQLIGFGTFETAVRAEREGTNPRTGEKVTIPETKLPKFKPGKALKDKVNE